MAVTQQQIADICGVTKQAVNLVLNGRGQAFAEKTRQRIIETADRLGYRAHVAASATARGLHGGVALIISAEEAASQWSHRLLHGIAEGAEKHRTMLVLCEIQGQPDNGLTDAIGNIACDGVLMNYVYEPTPAMIKAVKASGKPTVWLNNKLPKDAVFPDDFAGAQLLTRRLQDIGHRRIAYVNPAGIPLEALQNKGHYSMRERWDGYRQAMLDAGLTPQLIASGQSKKDLRLLAAAATEVLRDPQTRPTAVVCYNYGEAEMIMLAAYRLGLDIPADLSVATFHSSAELKLLGLPVTMALLPSEELGIKAMDMLFAKLADKNHPQPSLRLPLAMLEQETTGPPSK